MNQSALTKKQHQGLLLLARGGVRYGSRLDVMKELTAMNLCYAHDNGKHLKKGRWTWRPTLEGKNVISKISLAARNEKL